MPVIYRFEKVGKSGETMGGVLYGDYTVERALEVAFEHLEHGDIPVSILQDGKTVYDADAIRLEWVALKLRADGPSRAAYEAKIAALTARQLCTADQEVCRALWSYRLELEQALETVR